MRRRAAGNRGCCSSERLFDELDHLDELIDDTGLRGEAAAAVAGARRESAGRRGGAAAAWIGWRATA